MRHHVPRWLLAAVTTSGLMAAGPIAPAPVLADCVEHGRSVRTPDDARGTAFIGSDDAQSDAVIGVEANADGAVRVLLAPSTPGPIASAEP